MLRAAQARQQHLHGEQRDERDDAAEQRNGGVLQRNRGELGNQYGDGKFRGGQLTELPLSGKAQTADERGIYQKRAHE